MADITVAVLAERIGTAAGGTEVYERCLLSALTEKHSGDSADIEIVPLLAHRTALDLLPEEARSCSRILWPEGKLGTLFSTGRHLKRVQANLLHSCFITPPFVGDIQVIATIHDLGFLRFPDHYPRTLVWKLKRALDYTVRKAAMIITVSESTRQDLLELTSACPEKVITVYNGLDDRFGNPVEEAVRRETLERFGVREPFILYAGRLQPRKNVGRLVAAYERLRSAGRFHGQLVLLGADREFFCEGPQARIDASLYRQDIVQTGHLPDSVVAHFYAGAQAFVFVSLFEGFGFPVLEAMASGIPVVCSNVTSLPEIAGNAALLVDPLDADQIADALDTVLSDDGLRQRLIRDGRERAKEFTWQRTADVMRTVYRAAILGRSPKLTDDVVEVRHAGVTPRTRSSQCAH